MQRRIDPAAAIVLLAFVGYFGLARVVGNLYPFSTFPMYSGHEQTSASRIVARAADGSLHEVETYARWACDAPLERVLADRCPALESFSTIPYIDREILAHLAESPAPSGEGESVELVRNVWRFGDGPGAPRTESCVLSRCRAIRK